MLERNASRLESEVANLGALSFACDVSDEPAVNAAVATAQSLGGLDGVINSAGIDLMRPFGGMSLTSASAASVTYSAICWANPGVTMRTSGR